MASRGALSLALAAVAAAVAAAFAAWRRRERQGRKALMEASTASASAKDVPAAAPAPHEQSEPLPSSDDPPKESVPDAHDVPAAPSVQVSATAAASSSLPLSERLTIILSTSPVGRHPATDLIEETIGSMCLAPGLEQCSLIVVCDGYRTENGDGVKFTEPKYRSGIVDAKSAANYEEYKKRLRAMASKHPRPGSFEVVECKTRNGFGFAVKEALAYVKTPYVIIMQHDRTLMHEVNVERLVAAMEANPSKVKYIGLPTATTLGHQYHVLSKYKITIEPFTADAEGLQLLPLIQWYDSCHVAEVEYYRNFVFGPRKLVARGGFIEDKFGQTQLADIRKRGVDVAHPEYGTFVAVGPDEFTKHLVGHLDGRDALNTRKYRWATVANSGASAVSNGSKGRKKSSDSSPKAATEAKEEEEESQKASKSVRARRRQKAKQ